MKPKTKTKTKLGRPARKEGSQKWNTRFQQSARLNERRGGSEHSWLQLPYIATYICLLFLRITFFNTGLWWSFRMRKGLVRRAPTVPISQPQLQATSCLQVWIRKWYFLGLESYRWWNWIITGEQGGLDCGQSKSDETGAHFRCDHKNASASCTRVQHDFNWSSCLLEEIASLHGCVKRFFRR